MGLVTLVSAGNSLQTQAEQISAADSKMHTSTAKNVAEATSVLSSKSPHVIVLGPKIAVAKALEFAENVSLKHPATRVVMIVADITTAVLKEALKSGVKEVLSVDDLETELPRAIHEAHAAADRWRTAAGHDGSPGPEEPKGLAKVVTIFSTKGGVGKSVIATNLAAALAGKFGQRVVLVDLDLQFGDVAIMLRLVQEKTITDVVKAFDRLDSEMLDGFLVKHTSGLKALLAPIQPEEAELVGSANVERIIELLRQVTDYIIVDTPASFSEEVLTALDNSDVIYAIATTDVPSIRNVKIALQKLRQLNFDGDKVKLVLNRSDSKVWLQPGEIEKAIDSSIVAKIPSDRTVPRSVNKGVPVVMDATKSLVSRSLMQLAEDISAEERKEVTLDVVK